MAGKISVTLPADLPENWNNTMYVAPEGESVGLTEQHGYNYLMKQVNNSHTAINELDAEMTDSLTQVYQTLGPALIPEVLPSYYDEDNEVSIQLANMDYNKIAVSGDTTGTDVGTFTVTLTLRDPNLVWEDSTTEEKSLTWKILPKIIEAPTVTGYLRYTGEQQQAPISEVDTRYVTFTGETKGTDAQTYTVSYSLNDPTRYVWSTGAASDINVVWQIYPKILPVPIVINDRTFTFNAESQTPQFTNYDPELVDLSNSAQVMPGTYIATFLTKSNNYGFATDKYVDGVQQTSTTLQFSWAIEPYTISKPRVQFSTGSTTTSGRKYAHYLGGSCLYVIWSDEVVKKAFNYGYVHWNYTASGDTSWFTTEESTEGVYITSASGSTYERFPSLCIVPSVYSANPVTITLRLEAVPGYDVCINVEEPPDSLEIYSGYPSENLDDCEWEIISDTTYDDDAPNFWNVGDVKYITLCRDFGTINAGDRIGAFIVGFNHNSDNTHASEYRRRITFMLGKINGKDVSISDRFAPEQGSGGYPSSLTADNYAFCINYEDPASYANSDMVKLLNDTSYEFSLNSIIADSDKGLDNEVSLVYLYSLKYGTSSATTETGNYFYYLPSICEILGPDATTEYQNNYWENYYCSQFAYFKAGNPIRSYTIKAHDSSKTSEDEGVISDEYSAYWTRTLVLSDGDTDAASFFCVSPESEGGLISKDSTYRMAIRPCFVVGYS